MGRLGNQMFIYAFAKAVEYYSGETVFFDTSGYDTHPIDVVELDKVFNIKLNILPKNEIDKVFKPNPFTKIKFIKKHKKFFKFLLKDASTKENQFNVYQQDLLTKRGNVYYDGYFQCEKYFEEIQDEIKSAFTFKPNTDDKLNQYIKEIESYECPIFIHVRRGDYVTLSDQNIVHWLCEMSYYQKATQFMAEKYPNCTFIAISDDPEWLKENLKINYSFKIYSTKLDIMLLKACKHGICANSSYSWWGAWLINNPDKTIIAPYPWFEDTQPNDIIPDNWIKFPRY